MKSPYQLILGVIDDLWSGRLEFFQGDHQVGSIVFHEGRIAWATCVGQSETLGVFLWRLGRISREQLAEVQAIFARYSGKKKLGAILQEQGMMSRPVLRRCLMLHTRSAIERLLADDQVQVLKVSTRADVDEKILFGPEDVLPVAESMDMMSEWLRVENTWVRSWYLRTAENAVLEDLADVMGYVAAAIISSDGDVISAHVAQENLDMTVLAVYIAAMLESSSRAVHGTLLSGVEHLTLSCGGGLLSAQWLDTSRRTLVLVLTDISGQLPLTRYAVKATLPRLQQWLARGAGEPRSSAERSAPDAIARGAGEPRSSAERSAPDAIARGAGEPDAAAETSPATSKSTDTFAYVRTRSRTPVVDPFKPEGPACTVRSDIWRPPR